MHTCDGEGNADGIFMNERSSRRCRDYSRGQQE